MMSLSHQEMVNYAQHALFIEECPSKRKMGKILFKAEKIQPWE